MRFLERAGHEARVPMERRSADRVFEDLTPAEEEVFDEALKRQDTHNRVIL